MRKTIVLTLLGAASASGMSKLDALSMIESADNDSAVGQAGEVSRFQIKPHIWRHYSPNPAYRNSALARVVADRLMNDLETEFRKRARREPNDFDRYVLWNAGPAYYARIGYSGSRVSRIVRERATRYANLCQLLPTQASVMVASRPGPQPSPSPSLGTNAVPAVVFSLESRPVQMEFPAFTLQAELPQGTSTDAAPPRKKSQPPAGIVATTLLNGK